jgi:hypothetical protein
VSGEDKKEPDPKQSDSAESDAGKASKSSWVGLLEGAAKALMPVLLTGASLIGFVAFSGAVIVWTRFNAIGVPPDQAVRAVPRNELVATGSSLLLLFGFFGVLAVVATYLVDRGGRATPGMSRALLLIVAVEGIIVMVLADGVSMVTKLSITLGFLTFVGLAIVATFDKRFATYSDELGSRDGETKDPVRGPDSLHTALGNLRIPVWLPIGILLLLAGLGALVAILVFGHPAGIWRSGAWLLAILAGAALLGLLVFTWSGIEASKEREGEEEEAYERDRKLSEAGLVGFINGIGEWIDEHRNPKSKAQILAAKEAERLGKPRPHRLALRFWGVCLLVGLAGAAIIVPGWIMGQWWLAVSFAAAFVLATGVWRVAALSKPGFMWFGLAVFISVPLFGTCTLMARNVSDPQVQPMALIRSTDGPGESIQGIYVTEGSDRIYFASVATEGCEEELTPDSGRLQWVPKSEVVAMSVGPLQDVDKAGKAALEMADALTPSIETPTGEQVSLSTAEEPGATKEEDKKEADAPKGGESPAKEQEEGKEGGKEEEENEAKAEEEEEEAKAAEEEAAAESAEAEAAALDQRLASAGPAIRPNFGTGLKLVPAAAEPGDVVELRMSAPNTENGVDGFGETREGFDLRHNGVPLAVLRVPAEDPAHAEYVKTVGGRVLPIAGYFTVENEEKESKTGFIRLEHGVVRRVTDAKEDQGGLTLELDSSGKLAPLAPEQKSRKAQPPTVTLPNGEEEALRYGLLRRSWSPTKIKFRVPSNAKSGVVSVECGQLAGEPVLAVVHPPVARIAVRVHPGTERLTFDSTRSVDESKAAPVRHWTVAGRSMGKKPLVSAELPPRLTPYEVSLTLSDASGFSDRVDLRIWRLPSSAFTGVRTKRAKRQEYERRVRDALEAAMSEQQPAAIELDGHADLEKGDVGHSLTDAERMRKLLFAPHEGHRDKTNGTGGIEAAEQVSPPQKAGDEKPLLNVGPVVPLLVRAFGESCPIFRHPGPQPVNGRVEVFLLGPGATVGTGKHCHTARSSRVSW